MADISKEELRKEITAILKDADLSRMSAKKVRQLIEEKFDVDLIERKKEVDDLIMECLQEKKKKKAASEESEDDEEEEEEEFEEKEEEEEKKPAKRNPAKKTPNKRKKGGTNKMNNEEKKKRAAKTTPKQYELYLEELRTNKAFKENQLDVTRPNIIEESWKNLTKKLNSSGGPVKLVQEWKRVFRYWVSQVKSKARKIKVGQQETSNKENKLKPLSDLEKSLLSLVNNQSSFTLSNAIGDTPKKKILSKRDGRDVKSDEWFKNKITTEKKSNSANTPQSTTEHSPSFVVDGMIDDVGSPEKSFGKSNPSDERNGDTNGSVVVDVTSVCVSTSKSPFVRQLTVPSCPQTTQPSQQNQVKAELRQRISLLRTFHGPDVVSYFQIITACSAKNCDFVLIHECSRLNAFCHKHIAEAKSDDPADYSGRSFLVDPNCMYTCAYCKFQFVHKACWMEHPTKMYKHYANEFCVQCNLQWIRSVVKPEYKRIWNCTLRGKGLAKLKEITCWYDQNSKQCDCGCVKIDHQCEKW